MKCIKKINIIFFTVYMILNFIFFNPGKNVLASDLMEVDDYDLSGVQKVLDNEDYKEIDFVQMVKKLISGESNTVLTDTITYVFEKSVKSINFYKDCVINILCIALVSAFFTNFATASLIMFLPAPFWVCKKLTMICRPSGVSTDSGWNCTP